MSIPVVPPSFLPCDISGLDTHTHTYSHVVYLFNEPSFPKLLQVRLHQVRPVPKSKLENCCLELMIFLSRSFQPFLMQAGVVSCIVLQVIRCHLLLTMRIGLPDIPYFTGAPVFQPQSPASRNEATREIKSPVFGH